MTWRDSQLFDWTPPQGRGETQKQLELEVLTKQLALLGRQDQVLDRVEALLDRLEQSE